LHFFPDWSTVAGGKERIMIHVLVHHQVADYTAWKAAFDAALDWRHKNGETYCRIFRTVGHMNNVTIFFEWDSLEKAQAFIGSDELKKKMAAAGVTSAPQIEFLNEVHTLRRSAAD
jgi:hypothetical protein